MQTLTQIYLKKLLILFSILLISALIIIYFWLKNFYIKELSTNFQNSAKLITLLLQKSNSYQKTISNLSKELNISVDLIKQDGTIIATSNSFQNFQPFTKPEFILAKEYNQSTFIRKSIQKKQKVLFYVQKIKLNNKVFYLRLSKSLKEINQYIITLFLELLAIIIFLFLLSFYFLYKIGLDIENEIKKIILFLKELTKKKKESTLSSNYSKEFSQITKLLSKIAKIINKRQKMMQKYTKKLEKSNRQKESIISAISHEFKNPLAVISGYAQTLIENKNLDPALQKRFLQKIQNSSIQLNNLLNTLRLSIALDDRNKILHKKPISLLQMLQNIINLLQEHFPNRKILIQGDDIKIKVDKELFEIVLKNLIENALKYSSNDVIVKIDTNKISIIDSGIGIEQDKIPKITKKFYRINKNIWNNSLGLGLFIVDNILKLHNFKLQIQSKINQGSVFTILLTKE